MDKSELRILIIEDDTVFGNSLVELFRRTGFSADLATNPDQAFALWEKFEYHALIVDCMLPKMSGVDLSRKLLKKAETPPPLVLMTGVFKDKNFSREAMAKTGALTFFHKPFHVEKLVSVIDKQLESSYEAELEPIPSILTKEECSSADILEAFATQASFNAYQLPLVFSLFSRQGMTGELSVVTAERTTCSITMLDGKIVDVRDQNKATQLGEMLIEYGFVVSEDVDEVIANTPNSRPLGQRLVMAGALSPHAVELIREEQLAIRLSQMIRNTSIEISWLKKNIAMKETFFPLPAARLKKMMSEWTLSKIPADYLQSFYLPFADRKIGWRGKAAVKIDGAKANMPYLPILLKSIAAGPTLQDLLVAAGDQDVKCLQALHTLVLERKIFFSDTRETKDDFEAKISRYQKLLASFAEKNLYQIIGVSQNARKSEVDQAYLELAKVFHPDKVPSRAPEELKRLCNDIFAHISNANNILSDEARHADYRSQLSRKQASKIMEFEPVYQEAIANLEAKKYDFAAKKFDNLLKRKLEFPDLHAYCFWAKMKRGIRITDRDFFEVPPEHRQSAVYMMAKALHFRQQRQYQKAIECLQTAKYINRSLFHLAEEMAELLVKTGKRKREETFIGRILGKKRSA